MKKTVLLTLFLLLIFASACSLAEDVTPPPNYVPPTPVPTATPLATPAAFDLEAGKAIYQEKCLACHGPTGMGDGPQAAALGVPVARLGDPAVAAQATLAEWYRVVTDGRIDQMMPPFQSLTDQQRWDVVAYAMTLHQGGATPATAPAPTEGVADAPAATPGGAAATEAPPEAPDVPAFIPVSGTVRYGNGENLPSDLRAELRGYDPDDSGNFTLAYAEAVDVNPDGTFVVEKVPFVAHRGFVVTVTYQGVEYTSDPQFLLEGQELQPFEVFVYDTTSDPSALLVQRMHLFVDQPAPDRLQVVEVYVISNEGLLTVVPTEDGAPAVTFTLPENATNLQLDGGILGGRFIETADGFGDTMPIPALSQQQVIFSYNLPYDGKLDFTRRFTLNVDSIVVLLPDGMKLQSDYFSENGQQTFQGMVFNMYSSQPIPAGGEIALRIKGRSNGEEGAANNSRTNLLVGIGGLGFVLIALGGWFYYRDRNLTEPEEEEGFENIEAVLDAIIALDERYQAGDLPEEAYRKRRAELKARLRELQDA